MKDLIIDLRATLAEGRILVTIKQEREDEDKLFGSMTRESNDKDEPPYPYGGKMAGQICRMIDDACNMQPIK